MLQQLAANAHLLTLAQHANDSSITSCALLHIASTACFKHGKLPTRLILAIGLAAATAAAAAIAAAAVRQMISYGWVGSGMALRHSTLHRSIIPWWFLPCKGTQGTPLSPAAGYPGSATC
jgi:hypothetical protein